MEHEPVLTEETDNTVLELLDRVLNTGVVLVGDVTITVADIELIYLRLQLMLSSAETARQAGWLAVGPHLRQTDESVSLRRLRARPRRKSPMAHWDTLFPDDQPDAAAGAGRRQPGPRLPSQIRIDPENVRNGLVQLVLTLIELLRELLERQALRRIDGGSLTAEEIERLGLTFLRLSEEMDRLKQQFGLTDDDLNLDLGPLGKLR